MARSSGRQLDARAFAIDIRYPDADSLSHFHVGGGMGARFVSKEWMVHEMQESLDFGTQLHVRTVIRHADKFSPQFVVDFDFVQDNAFIFVIFIVFFFRFQHGQMQLFEFWIERLDRDINLFSRSHDILGMFHKVGIGYLRNVQQTVAFRSNVNVGTKVGERNHNATQFRTSLEGCQGGAHVEGDLALHAGCLFAVPFSLLHKHHHASLLVLLAFCTLSNHAILLFLLHPMTSILIEL
mmetsp:Transcript_475/g.770  ORF Transcript_475/g.770 Transcript_475/m.770 type:complete len:238 (-) Transcript_475:366-1079(-)